MYTELRKKIGLFNLKRAFNTIQRRIRRLDENLKTDALVDFVFMDQHKGYIDPFQKIPEIKGFINLIEKTPPKNILEIGTANGGSLFLMARVSDPDALIISIDLPAGNYGGGYQEWKMPFYKSFAKANQTIHLLRENSHESETFEKVKKILNGEKLDLLFIDGDHTYEGVRHDFLSYKELVKPDGIIGVHDIVPHFHSHYGVARFWQEIKNDYDHLEFIDKPTNEGCGIGVLKPTGKFRIQ